METTEPIGNRDGQNLITVRTVALAFGLLIVLGVVLASQSRPYWQCQLQGCDCTGNETIDCNECQRKDPVFVLPGIEIAQFCTGTQYQVCRNGTQREERTVYHDCHLGLTTYTPFLDQRPTVPAPHYNIMTTRTNTSTSSTYEHDH